MGRGRITKSTMETRRDLFRVSLSENLSDAEIMDRLGLGERQLNDLMGMAAREQWAELKNWHPTSNTILAKSLPSSLQEKIRTAAGFTDEGACSLVNAEVRDGGVFLCCTCTMPPKAQAALPGTTGLSLSDDSGGQKSKLLSRLTRTDKQEMEEEGETIDI